MTGTVQACAIVMASCLSCMASAQSPHMGGPMVHLVVDFDGQTLSITPESTGPLVLHRYEGERYRGGAAVLDGTAYNAQYGWLVGGFWFPPGGSAVWIGRIESTPGLAVYAQGTFAPIHGTDGSPDASTWNGVMLHNWYAAESPGPYEALYRVWFGDPVTGEPLEGFAPAEVLLQWVFEGAACPGDLDGDGTVAGADLAILLGSWGEQGGAADLDGDGVVGGADLAVLLGGWGECP